MLQKITWTIALIFGILISFYSCDKIRVDKVQYMEYHFINNSGHDITINVYQRRESSYAEYNYAVAPYEEFSQEFEIGMGDSSGGISFCDSVIVRFDNERYSTFTPTTMSSYNILDPINYEFVKVDDHLDSYTYTFTKGDYEYARVE